MIQKLTGIQCNVVLSGSIKDECVGLSGVVADCDPLHLLSSSKHVKKNWNWPIKLVFVHSGLL